MSTFDYKEFAHDIAEQAGNLVPRDIDKNTKNYIFKAVKSFTQMTGEAISKNESLNLDDEESAFFCQIIAEVVFNKSLALADSDVPQEYWDAILQRIAFYIFEITKESIKKRKEKFELLKLAEFHANKSYDEALEELVKKNIISKDVTDDALSMSNPDLIEEESTNSRSNMQESLDKEGRTKIKFGSIIKNRLINFFESISDRIKYFFEITLGILVISFKSKTDMIRLCFATLSLYMYNHFFIPISEFITKYGFSVKTVSNIVYLTVAFVFISIIVSNFKKTIENNVAKNLEKLEELKQKMQALLDPDKQFERLGVDILCLQVGNGLIPLADPMQDGQILPRLTALRQKLTDELGYVIPDLRIIDNSNLEENEYEIYIRNKCVARGVVFPDKIMVYPDCLEKNKYKKLKETSEINFDYKNTVVYWTDKDIAESLNIEGIDSADFILNHIENIVIEQVDKILTMTTTYKYINLCYSQDYMEHVLKDLMIRLEVADIRNVLVNLVKQRISIKDITYVFEKLNDYSRSEKNPENLAKMIKEDLI